MKAFKICSIFIFVLFSRVLFSQQTDPFLYSYSIYKSYHPEKAKEYKEIEGSPYLNDEFQEGTIYMLDTVVIKLPLRYNMYTDEMEYQLKGTNYIVANPQDVNKIEIGKSIFVYSSYNKKSGYFDIFESGRCMLVQKKMIAYKPAEGPKAIVGVAIPAQFVRKDDTFYLIINCSQTVKIDNLKAVLKALEDQKDKMETFIKQEKINNIRKQNLVKIIKYYNSL